MKKMSQLKIWILTICILLALMDAVLIVLFIVGMILGGWQIIGIMVSIGIVLFAIMLLGAKELVEEVVNDPSKEPKEKRRKLRVKYCEHSILNAVVTDLETPLATTKGKIILQKVPAEKCASCDEIFVDVDQVVEYLIDVLGDELKYCLDHVSDSDKKEEQ